MKSFATLTQVQAAYLTYVHTFQKFRNSAIRDWVAERVKGGTPLCKEPCIYMSRPSRPTVTSSP
jgi:hypothetical protein